MISFGTDKESLVKNENERCSYLTDKVFSYSSDVLIGNWMESRYRQAVKKNNAILPGLMIDDKCERHLTASQATYTAAGFDLKKATSAHMTLKGEVRAIKLEQGSNLILHDANEFLTNCTTMNNLMFDIWPKLRLEECLKMKLLGKTIYKRVPFNPLDSYGNNSLIVKKPSKMNEKNCETLGVTSYQMDYPPKVSEKYEKKDDDDVDFTDYIQEEAAKNCQIQEDFENTINPISN